MIVFYQVKLRTNHRRSTMSTLLISSVPDSSPTRSSTGLSWALPQKAADSAMASGFEGLPRGMTRLKGVHAAYTPPRPLS